MFKANCSTENMCDTCEWGFEECCASQDSIEFGNGQGNDNIIQCDSYSGSEYEYYEDE